MTLCGKECYGWWADRQALDNACETCKVKELCYKRWVEDGGKVGGYFDKARESEKIREILDRRTEVSRILS